MSTGIENVRSQSPFDDDTRFGGVAGDAPEEEQPKNPLDSAKSLKLLGKLRDWYQQEVDRQGANRYQMALDEDYYDGLQWTEEEAQELLDRGQAPLVFNEIMPTIDFMIGTERRMRVDSKVLPRRKDPESQKDSELKTMLLKYLSDVNKTTYHRSEAFESAIKAGIGWLETGVRGDPTDELLFTRAEDWRNILHDSTSRENDGSDMRFTFRIRWTDDDIAIAYFPERDALIRKSVVTADSLTEEDEQEQWYMGARVTQPGHDYAAANVGKYHPFSASAHAFSRRSRVKLIECWYKQPKLIRRFNGGEYDSEVFDSNNQQHIAALKDYSLYDKLEMEIRCAIFCSAGLLFDGPSPYKHGKLPFVPVWCYRRRRDGLPYGKVRGLRDPQDDLNKRHSKALFILSTNRVVADEGAVEDWDELREEVARPDSMIIKRSGKELTVERDVQLAEEHLKLMEADALHIRNAGSVNNESLGRSSNATSGVAIQARQEQGSVANTKPFDNLRLATQLLGEMELSNIEQFYVEPKVVRITGERGQPKFEEINSPDESGNILNDITRFQADYVVGEQDYRTSLRQAMFEQLFDIVGRLAQMNPNVALNLLDLVVEMADLPGRDQLVARIRSINGQRDPDKEQTPEEMQAEQAQKEKQALQEQIAMQTLQNQLQKLASESANLDAKTITQRIESMIQSLTAAQIVTAAPVIAPVADEIMKGAEGSGDQPIPEVPQEPAPPPMEQPIPAAAGMQSPPGAI